LKFQEIVALTLRKVVYRHTDYSLLGDFLVEKYGFKRIEEAEHKVSHLREIFPIDRGKILFEEEADAPIVSEEVERKYSSLKIFEGNYLEAKIMVYVLGEIIHIENIVEVSEAERYRVHSAEYQMIKLVSESGYALQQFIERLNVDLGLQITLKEWSFHRG